MGCCQCKSESKIIKEVYAGGPKRLPKKDIDEASKAICKISYTGMNGTGFFLFSSFNRAKLLVTNYHIITKDITDSNMSISIEFYDKKIFTINLKNYENYIHFFKELDITTIQINAFNKISNNAKFLEIDYNYMNGYNDYFNNDVFALGYPFGADIEYSAGKITYISDNRFYHTCDTDYGSSGSPIILMSNKKVIGIHCGGKIEEKINVGTFLGEILGAKINYQSINSENNKYINKNNEFNLTSKGGININNENIKINNDSNSNYIIAEFNIDESNINKYIQIINSYEAVQRSLYETEEILKDKYLQSLLGIESWEELENNQIKFDEINRNENEIKECKMEIEGKIIPFSYFYKFKKKGTYKIIYSFNYNLKSLDCLFCSCSSLINLDLSNFNSKNVITMNNMFFYCNSLRNIDFSNFNIPKVRDMLRMFCFCGSLKYLDLSNFNTQNVTNMNCMFAGCESLISLDLSKFNTQHVTNMADMFSDCRSLKSLDLSNFNTQKVETMASMFSNCESLIYLDLSSFNTLKVNNMNSMFKACKSLTNLNLSNFNTQNVTNMENMFFECKSLNNLDLSNFSSQKVINMQGMFHFSKLKISDIICYDKKIIENYVKNYKI